MKNLGHPTADQLIARRSEWLELPEHIERRNEYGKEIGKVEFERDQFLWTMYRYEIDNNLTLLDYDDWSIQLLQRNSSLRTFVHRTGLLANDKDNIIEFLCSKRLSLINHLNNLRHQAIDPYGDESYSGGFDYSDYARSTGTNIILQGNQNVKTAIKTFNAVHEGNIFLTYTFACSKSDFDKVRNKMLQIDMFTRPTTPGCFLTGTDDYAIDGDTALYIRKITKSGRCKSLY